MEHCQSANVILDKEAQADEDHRVLRIKEESFQKSLEKLVKDLLNKRTDSKQSNH